MKQLFKTMLSAAAAAMVLSGCSENDTEDIRPTADLRIKAGAIAATPESRAYIGEQDGDTYPMLWTETGETFAILELADPDYENDKVSRKEFINPTAYTVTNANKQANFSFELTKNGTAKRFDYFVCSPASAFYSLTPKYLNANVTVPAEQAPAQTSADPAASILFAYMQNLTAQPTEASPLTLQFKHVVAYGKMTVKALPATSGTIQTVTFTGNKSEDLAGGYYYYYSGETGNENTFRKTTLTLDVSALNLDATKPFDVWFACKPVELPYGYKVTVTTSDNTEYTRKVDAGTLKFEAGKISQFGVLMNKLSEPDLGIDNTTASSFTASWKPVANATEYAWKVAAANDPNAIVKSGTTTETTLTVSDGLTAGASYVLYVKAVAGDGFVDSEYAVSNEFTMVEAVTGGTDDFSTLKNNSKYDVYTTTAGWVGTNCCVLSGGPNDSNPVFNSLLGEDENVKALCMNGKTTAVGTITSPEITTGCGTLTFDYGFPYGDKHGISFKVEVKQNGTVVKTFTVTDANATKLQKYSFSEAVNIAGTFQIVFTNLSPSHSTSNNDRFAIFNIAWTGYME